MSGVELRAIGTTATMAPLFKRAIVTMSTGRAVSLWIDENRAGTGLPDVTGTAKMYFYVSDDTARTSHTLRLTYTPGVAPASSSRAAIASISQHSDTIYVAWVGVDNNVYCSTFSYNTGTHAVAHVATQTVASGGAITNRYRKVDIDVRTNPVVSTYEAHTSGGLGSYLRVYCRMNDGTTWRMATEHNAVTIGQTIAPDSPDVSVCIRGDGVVSNVIRFALYGTQVSTAADKGDLLREYSFNVSTGTVGSAATLATWSATLNKGVAGPSRRGILYSISSTTYILTAITGSTIPRFHSIKLGTSNYASIAAASVGYVSTVSLSNFFRVEGSYNYNTSWTSTYRDNRVIFAFAGIGTGAAPRVAREIVMTYPNSSSISTKPSVDSIPRPIDQNYYGDGGPFALYGGDNKFIQSGNKQYSILVAYGRSGNAVATTFQRRLRFVAEDTFDAPAALSPSVGEVVPNNQPTFRVRVENTDLTPNLYGKIEVQVATDSGFTTNVDYIIQPDSALQYFGTKDGLNSVVKQVVVSTPTNQSLFTGTWYWRARIVSDKDTPGAWSTSQTFGISHPPAASPLTPAQSQVVTRDGSDNVNFSWTFTDTEPNDSQSEYYIIVKDATTGASLVDTGWVSSSARDANIFIDDALLEIPLTWTVQARDADGTAGPVSTPVNFTVGDAPVVDIVSPANLSIVTTAAPTVTWSFTGSGGRTQKSYRVRITETAGANQIANPSFETDTLGWIGFDASVAQSGAQAHSGVMSALVTPNGTGYNPRIEQTVAAGMPVILGQSVTVDGWILPSASGKDSHIRVNWYDSVGSYVSTTQIQVPPTPGVWQQLTLTAAAPVTGFACAGMGVVNTPTVGETFYVDEMRLYETDATSGEVVADTFWRSSIDTSHPFLANILETGVTYDIVLQVMDTGGLVSADQVQVVTDWVEPALGNATVVPDPFKVAITWDDSTIDGDFVGWRIYRRYRKPAGSELDVTNTEKTWVLIHESSSADSPQTYYDYTAPLNRNVDFVVVQVVDRFGSLIESSITSWHTVVQYTDRFYFVPQIPIGSIASFEAANVTGDQFTREIEQETLHVVGRGRQVQVGDDLGYVGSLTLRLRNPATARLNREFLEAISAEHNAVYIKSPFGDVVLVALGSIQTSRQAGHGNADIVDLTVPYVEIIDADPVTRVGLI